MAKAIKLPDGYYWDSSSITHDRKTLDDILNNSILETGSNSNGTWRKYVNGDMECWFNQQVNVAVNSNWGILYAGVGSLHDFPQKFIEIPIVQISLAPCDWYGIIGRDSAKTLTKSNPGNIVIFRGTSAGTAPYDVQVYAKGKWK